MSRPRKAVLGRRPPRIHVGPSAVSALGGKKGLLLGARRSSWLDVLEFIPRPDATMRTLVELRYEDAYPWDVIGLSISFRDFARARGTLLRELVPGDAILTEQGALAHDGASWVEAPLVPGYLSSIRSPVRM